MFPGLEEDGLDLLSVSLLSDVQLLFVSYELEFIKV